LEQVVDRLVVDMEMTTEVDPLAILLVEAIIMIEGIREIIEVADMVVIKIVEVTVAIKIVEDEGIIKIKRDIQGLGRDHLLIEIIVGDEGVCYCNDVYVYTSPLL
jgi:hypothetical protein